MRWGWVRLLAACALGLSLFLLWGSLSGDKLPGCGLESGCGAVLHSKWSKLFGLPVSLPALLLYLGILAATFVLPRLPEEKRRAGWQLLTAAAAALIGAALWFIGLQFFVIHAICPFCMTAHTCGLILGTLLFWQAPKGKTPACLAGPAWAGWMGTVLLAAGQIVYQPKTYEVLGVAAENGQGTNTVLSTTKTNRTLTLHDGVFTLSFKDLPLMGSPDAPYVIVHLFDYSCQHCRQLHPILARAVKELTNQLAIVCLPVPLATNCNWLLKRPIPDHINACDYAYDGLALWRANPGKIHEFDDWIFKPARPLPPADTRREAQRLAGTNEFAAALKDPWIKEQITTDIRLYETNYVRYRRSQLPQLMIGTNIVSGVIKPNDLYRLLAAQFPIIIPPGANNPAAANEPGH
jgi:uncharacterized membrane protein/thiol-disulfide isomerase/thioredoxin